MPNQSKEKFKVYKNVFDNFTLRNLFKLAGQDYFDELKSPISIGKEANIFSATTKDNSVVIIKIYRLENCNFNKMYDYIKLDPRFPGMKRQRRKIIFSWTQREYRNLLKARDFIDVPIPMAFSNNIIVMEFIGNKEKEEVAPQIKDKKPKKPEDFFKKTIDSVAKLYKSGLVHGDLSQFNILNYNEKPVFIDFSQATTSDNMEAEDLLKRDLKNICNFFEKFGVKSNVDDIFEKIIKNKAKL
jgi:RIO kinase 1